MNLEFKKNEQFNNMWNVFLRGIKIGSITKEKGTYKVNFFHGIKVEGKYQKNIPSFEEAKKVFEKKVKNLIDFLSDFTEEDIAENIHTELTKISVSHG